jgi:spore coat protein U-like protein
MQRIKILVLALAAAGFSASVSTAVAADTATLNVSAKVVGTCKVTVNSGNLAFGNLDVGLATDATANSNDIKFWCTKGAAYTITDDDGQNELAANQNRMKSTTLTTPEYIPYSIAYTAAGTGTGPSTPITLGVSGTILNANYVGASADNYTDTVTFNITP